MCSSSLQSGSGEMKPGAEHKRSGALYPPQDEVNLTNCDREPIHIPGSIQPHGVLLVLDDGGRVVQASRNTEEMLGVAARDLIGKPLESLLDSEGVAALERALTDESDKYASPDYLRIGEQTFRAIPHRSGGGRTLELEPLSGDAVNIYPDLRRATQTLQRASHQLELSQIIAEEVRRLTGFDRVMVYRFDADWHGEVVAEAKAEGAHGFLGLHFPATDIPVQARDLYTRNWVRHIADVNYEAVPLEPLLNPLSGEPLDMAYAFLRSVSPIHIRYLKNMGVGASLSVSLIKEGKLWGLIACHHETARHVPYETLMACEFLGQVFSMQLATKVDSDSFAQQLGVKTALTRCIERVAGGEDAAHDLSECGADLLALADAAGAAVVWADDIHLLGITPTKGEVVALCAWLQDVDTQLFQTSALGETFPPAQSYAGEASGLLAVSVSKARELYVLWFRPAVSRTVTWGGEPGKNVSEDGELLPRSSFAAWQEEVEGTSLPWQAHVLEAADELRDTLLSAVFRHADKLARLNDELERSNAELDAFAYIASHDLKEPLRGIHNYSSFLLEDYGNVLDDEGVEQLNTLVRLSRRMEDLINSLLHFSRVGRVDLALRETDLNTVVEDVRQLLSARLDSAGAKLTVHPLPTVVCDSVRVSEVLNNLISNALKYSEDAPNIEVGVRAEDAPPVFYVRDNGIGISPEHQAAVFRLFKRLHGRETYGGGTGIGLTIVKKVVERHGGRLWLESVPGQGTTFYFTLAPEQE